MIKNTSEISRKSSYKKRKSVQQIDNMILKLKTNYLTPKSKSKNKNSKEKNKSIRKNHKNPTILYSHQVTPQNQSIQLTKQNKIQNATLTSKNCRTNKKVDPKIYLHNNYTTTNVKNTNTKTKVGPTKNDYRFIHKIGSGGFGKVWKVLQKKNNQVFAMKQISKAKVVVKKSVVSIINQKQLLNVLHNKFLINAYKSFQDRQNLYLVMEYLRGGDLRYHMCYIENFLQNQIKFIIACVIQGLEYIHSKKVIHRDLKPQNIVFQENGYARITDFGVARKYKDNNFEETSGTPGYMAPQVICRMNHSFQADFFALGVILYELIFGIRPYMGDSRKQIRQKILTRQIIVEPKDLPQGWNRDCAHLVTKLIQRNPQQRIGFKGIEQIKKHPWLATINWNKLKNRQIQAPYIPGIVCQSNHYLEQIDEQSQFETEPINHQQNTLLTRTEQIQNLFRNYESDNSDKFMQKTRNKRQIIKKIANNTKKKNGSKQYQSYQFQKHYMTTNHSNSLSFAKMTPFIEKSHYQNKICKMSVRKKDARA